MLTCILNNYISRDCWLEIAFNSKGLRQICESLQQGIEALGEEASSNMRNRLKEIFAATCLDDIFVLSLGDPKVELDDTLQAEVVTICIGGPSKLIFLPNHIRKKPVTDSGNIDWARITRLKLIKIEGCKDGT